MLPKLFARFWNEFFQECRIVDRSGTIVFIKIQLNFSMNNPISFILPIDIEFVEYERSHGNQTFAMSFATPNLSEESALQSYILLW